MKVLCTDARPSSPRCNRDLLDRLRICLGHHTHADAAHDQHHSQGGPQVPGLPLTERPRSQASEDKGEGVANGRRQRNIGPTKQIVVKDRPGLILHSVRGKIVHLAAGERACCENTWSGHLLATMQTDNEEGDPEPPVQQHIHNLAENGGLGNRGGSSWMFVDGCNTTRPQAQSGRLAAQTQR